MLKVTILFAFGLALNIEQVFACDGATETPVSCVNSAPDDEAPAEDGKASTAGLIDAYEQAPEQCPCNSEKLDMLVMDIAPNYIQLGEQHEHAKREKIKAAAGGDEGSMTELADAYSIFGNSEKALETYMKAMTELADAYSISGNSEKALETYNKVVDIEREPIASGTCDQNLEQCNEKMAIMDVAGQYIQQQNYEQAKKEIEKIKDLLHDDEEVAAVLEQFRNRNKAETDSDKNLEDQ